MESFETTSLREDPLIRALSGDASSPLYGGSLREPSAANALPENGVLDEPRQVSSMALLVAAIAFLGVALLYL